MKIVRCLIAGLKVEVGVRFEKLQNCLEKYRYDFEDMPDICVVPEEERLNNAFKNNPSITPEDIEYIATGSMFYYSLLKFGGFMLHSSTIAKDGKAYIFTANSGTGKSTHTSLWQKYLADVTMINDDKPAIVLKNGTFYAVGTPWSGKNNESTDIAVPVGGLVLLNRGKVNSIRKATPTETVPFIMQQTLASKKEENTLILVDLLDKFLQSVPAFILECDISEEAVKTSYEALTGKEYIKGN